MAPGAKQAGQRVGCTVSLCQQDADMLSSESHVQCRSELDGDLAVGNHIDWSTSQISENPRRGRANRGQCHPGVQFRCVADTLGTDSRRDDQPVVVGEVAKRRIECCSPIVRIGRFDERNMNDGRATFGKQPPELPGTITSDHNTSTGERTQSGSITRHSQFSASWAERAALRAVSMSPASPANMTWSLIDMPVARLARNV